MNISYKWLKDYVDFDMTADEVAAALTSVGLEVDGVEEVQSILALGAAGSTKLVYDKEHIERVENVKDVRSYLDRIDEMIERKRIGIGKWRQHGGEQGQR